MPSETAPRIPDHELLRQIGRGSYGEVWLARNIMGALRAVKVVRRGQFEDERPYEREFEAVRRYEPVSRAAEGLVNVLHVGSLEDDSGFYYVMELADDCAQDESTAATEQVPLSAAADASGADRYMPRTLASEMRTRGALPVADCVETAAALARGLAALHRAGLVHRDVKPANIIYVAGRAKLADIGLLGTLGGEASLVGTEGYLPPEGPGTTAADLYALGRVLYQMATGLGRHEWPRLPAAWLETSQEEALELVEVLLRANEGDATRRYQRAEEMLADLALLQGGKSIRRLRGLERRVVLLRRLGLGVGAAACVALLAFGLTQREIERQTAMTRAAETALFHAELARAQTSWRSGGITARSETLEAVRAAAGLRPHTPELRDEAITALALPDFPELRRVPYPFWGCALPLPGGAFLALDSEAGGDTPGRLSWVDPDGSSTPRPDLGTTGEPDHSRNDALNISADARWLAVLCHSYRKRLGTLQMRPLQAPAETATTPGSAQPSPPTLSLQGVAACAFSPDSTTLAASGWENELRFYDPGTGQQTGGFPLPGIPGHELHWSPDGSLLAVLLVPLAAESLPQQGRQQPVELLLVDRTGTVQARTGFPHSVWDMAWEADGGSLLLAAREMGVWRWRWRSGEPPQERWAGHESEVIAIAADPRGEYVLTSSWDRTTRLWSAPEGRLLAVIPGYGRRLQFLENGALMAREDMDRKVWIIHEVRRPRIISKLSLPQPKHRHHGTLGPRTLDFSPDGLMLAAADADGCHLWHLRAQTPAQPLTPEHAHCHGIIFDEGGRQVIFNSMIPPGVWSLGLTHGSQPEKIPGFTPQRGALIMGLRAATATRSLAVSVENAILVRWQDGRLIQLEQPMADFGTPALSPDARWAAAGARGGPVWVWELPSGRVAHQLDVEGERPTVHFSPPSSAHGSLLLVGDTRGLHAYSLTEGLSHLWTSPIRESGAPAPLCASASATPALAATLARDAAWLLDPATGHPLARLRLPHARSISCLAMSPDGTRLAAGSWLHTVTLWHLDTLRQELETQSLAW